MLTIGFLRNYRERPAHFANTWAALYTGFAFLLVVASLFVGLGSVQGFLTLLTGVCFVGFAGACFIAGLFAELVIRQNRRSDTDAYVTEISMRPALLREPVAYTAPHVAVTATA